MGKKKFQVGERVRVVKGWHAPRYGYIVKIERDVYDNRVLYTVRPTDRNIRDFYANSGELVSNEPYCYIASGWFDESQERTRLACLGVLKEYPEIKIFSPKDEVICPADASQDFAEAVYRGNVDAIKRSTFIVCNTEKKDMGTLHESGVAAEAGIPIIYYAELPKGAKFNLMLARSGVAVATNPDELRAAIQHFKDHNWDFSQKIPYTGNIE